MTRTVPRRLLVALAAAVLAAAALLVAAARPAVAAAATFRNPLASDADPFMTYHAGNYYLTDTRFGSIQMWRSPSIGGLLGADPVTVWTDSDGSRNQEMWAPAFFRLDGPDGVRWYLYYTADNGDDNRHRMYVLESAGDDPLGPYSLKAQVTPDEWGWAIDGTVLQRGGALYFVWSGEGDGVRNRLYVAPMSDPWTLSGPRVYLPADGGCPEVREAPAAVHHGDRTFLAYSTCDTGKPDYQVWTTSIRDDQDPLDPGAWAQQGPLLTRNDATGVYGPGSNGFFTSPDGSQDWIVYHAKNTSAYTYAGRTPRAQRLDWNDDGTPRVGPALAVGATQDAPSGDPGGGGSWVNDTDQGLGGPQWSYAGPWNSGSGCGVQCFWGNDHWSDSPGATATVRFTGTRIVLLSVRDTGNGVAGISVDGDPEQRVDYYGSPRAGEVVQYVSPRLDGGGHTLTVRVTGEKRAESGAAFVSVDRAEVYP